MKPNRWRDRLGPAGTGLRVVKQSTSSANSITGPDAVATVLDRAKIPKLLRHHASYVDAILVMICTGESISIAGRKALRYTADRLREFAEVLNAR